MNKQLNMPTVRVGAPVYLGINDAKVFVCGKVKRILILPKLNNQGMCLPKAN